MKSVELSLERYIALGYVELRYWSFYVEGLE